LNNLEKILKNYSLFKSDLTPRCKKEPTFYSFTGNKIADFNIKQHSHIETNTSLVISSEKLYETLLEISSVCQNLCNNLNSPSDHVSIGYNFLYTWAILDPVYGPFSPSVTFLTTTVNSLFKPDLAELNDPNCFASNMKSNMKLAQLFRLAFKLTSANGLDEFLLNALRVISGNSIGTFFFYCSSKFSNSGADF